MVESSRYYLARVLKMGDLDEARLVEAIVQPVTIERGRYRLTFTDAVVKRDDGLSYVFGRLAKFEPEGEVDMVDPESHALVTGEVPNKLVASSPFVYIPDFAAIAFQHIWNLLEREQFMRLFPALITAKYEDFMVAASLEAISDLRTFVQRLSRFTSITRIQAAVHPPNPLFSPVWKDLFDYLRQRRLKDLHLRENAKPGQGVESRIPEIAKKVLEAPPEDSAAALANAIKQPSPIGDAAVLMAADGYGKAKIEGQSEGERLVVRTRETQVSFESARSPEPGELFTAARDKLKALSATSGLTEHG